MIDDPDKSLISADEPRQLRVLWLTQILLPAIAARLGRKATAGGGWLTASLDRLRALYPSTQFAVASLYDGKTLREETIDGVTYYLIPAADPTRTLYEPAVEASCGEVNIRFRPDVVHIHGTEYPFGLEWVNACSSGNVLVSMQGLISVIARYYTAGIDRFPMTFRDFVRRDDPLRQQKKFEARGRYETELLGKARHVAGRTSWDRAHALAVNPSLNYHVSGESLRPSFYGAHWSYDACRPHTIFISQGSYPLKGLHKVIEALPQVMRSYPDVRVAVAGDDPVNVAPWRRSGYGEYLRRLMTRLGVADRVGFLGCLDERAMLEAYLSANLFISPSSIENSSNSVAEALATGMPVIASYVGGNPDMLPPEALYRFEETEMLAARITHIFDMKDRACAPARLPQTWDADSNARALMSTYHDIIRQWR